MTAALTHNKQGSANLYLFYTNPTAAPALRQRAWLLRLAPSLRHKSSVSNIQDKFYR
jgi:hypothetical protein